MKNILKEIEAYRPGCAQEERDRALILSFLVTQEGAFLRTNPIGHMTASAWVISPDRRQVVMAYHRIYDSWAWVGGHADGERDLLAVALREAAEETGLAVCPVREDIFSLEVLAVAGHEKGGVYVPSHLHLNVTYLLQAQGSVLRVRPEESRAVAWMTPEEALAASTEPWMVEHVYRKLIRRARPYMG